MLSKQQLLNNRKYFLNRSQLLRFNRWNGNLEDLTFFYFRSKHNIGYKDIKGNRYNCVFSWRCKKRKSYILLDKDNILIEKISDGKLEWMNKRCPRYNQVINSFNKRDNTDLPIIYY